MGQIIAKPANQLNVSPVEVDRCRHHATNQVPSPTQRCELAITSPPAMTDMDMDPHFPLRPCWRSPRTEMSPRGTACGEMLLRCPNAYLLLDPDGDISFSGDSLDAFNPT